MEKWRSMKESWGLSGDLPVTVVREVWTLVIKQSILTPDNLPPESLPPHHGYHQHHSQDHRDSHLINVSQLTECLSNQAGVACYCSVFTVALNVIVGDSKGGLSSEQLLFCKMQLHSNTAPFPGLTRVQSMHPNNGHQLSLIKTAKASRILDTFSSQRC